MAACGSLQHIFKKPLPENRTLLESLSWNQIKSANPPEDSSFSEIFGELYFKENPQSFPPSSLFPPSDNIEKTRTTKNPSPDYSSTINRKQFLQNSDSFSSMNSESLQLCTEGLGFESSADVDELKSDVKINDSEEKKEEKIRFAKQNFLHENLALGGLTRRERKSWSEFPPPISCIEERGKPWVCFKSYRQNGRFVLKETRVPNQEFLYASREDGRLKLHFFHADNEILDEGEEEDDDDIDEDYSSDRTVEEEEEEEGKMMAR